MRFEKFSIHCINQNKSQNKYRIIQLNHYKYKDGYYIYKLSKQQDVWFV